MYYHINIKRNIVEEIVIKNRTNYFLDDSDIKNLDPNKIKIDKKSYKISLIC